MIVYTNTMTELPKQLHHCDFCDYKSIHNHNVLRHKRRVHKTDRVVELESTEGEPKRQDAEPHSDTDEEEEMTYNDLENMIDDKIGGILKSQGMGKINPKNLRQSAVKTFFNGNTGHLLAGVALGWILSNNMPYLMTLAKNSLVVSSQKSPVQMTPEEVQKRILAQQAIFQAMAQKSQDSPPTSSQSASPQSATPSSTL